MKIRINENEVWWGIRSSDGHVQPLDAASTHKLDITTTTCGSDQFSPILLSSAGRAIYADHPFSAVFADGFIETDADVTLSDGHDSLRGAYLHVMRAHIKPDGQLPDETFFTCPQYNTWIELGTDQTQEKILRYAHGILDHGLPAGVLMIDGGWQEDYGTFEFNRRKVPDPKAMIDELHALGFKVMLWVSPIVASAGTQFKMLRDKKYLIREPDGSPAIRKWWSGYSAVLDFTNPDAIAWYHGQLEFLMKEYGADGFKFDAGDCSFYKDTDRIAVPCLAREHTTAFNIVGVKYPLNEFRAAYDYGGRAIVARLHDKIHSWDKNGLNTLIPNTLVQGLLGYTWCCPDMVGGGEISSIGPDGKRLDEELFVRWAQANALMGMMQMSAAPWRVLSPEMAALVVDALALHAKLGDTFIALARACAESGEPMTRSMEYAYPHCGYERIADQFMLGDDILCAPVIEKGARSRSVVLPEGRWCADDGKVYDGGQTITIDVPLARVPYFTKEN